ncbi:PKD domain-containing protein [Marinimicrobium locisalis]|uniref:PKD domain-containing protein n=1 Tax=Marinimicrobium locisalis TaxID=546022 RepID=UPI0032216F46
MTPYQFFRGSVTFAASVLLSGLVLSHQVLAESPLPPMSSSSASSTQSSASSYAPGRSFNCEVASESVWSSGFVYSFEVANTGIEPVDGWEVIIEMPEGYTINHAWGADISGEAPEYRATGKPWNDFIASEQVVGFGLQGSRTGDSDEQPRCFAVGQDPHTELRATMNGQTVFVEALGFIEGVPNPESVTISWGDGHSVKGAHEAWHTYFFEGTYTIIVEVTSDSGTHRKTVQVEAGQWQEEGNHAPVAMIAADHSPGEVWMNTDLSMDPDGDEITKTMYTANSAFAASSARASSSSASIRREFSSSSRPSVISSSSASSVFGNSSSSSSYSYSSFYTVGSSSSSSSSRYSNSSSSFQSEVLNKVLTVYDGELGDTSQASGVSFEGHLDFAGTPRPLFRKRGLTLYVNAGYSTRTNFLRWDFGDGSDSNDPVTSHTYAEPGVYEVTLSTTGVFFVDDKTVSVAMGSDLAPSADFSCEASDELSFTCHPASDYGEDGDVLKFEWQVQGGTEAITTSVLPSAFFRVDEPGTYEVTLNVYDGTRWDEQTTSVTVP